MSDIQRGVIDKSGAAILPWGTGQQIDSLCQIGVANPLLRQEGILSRIEEAAIVGRNIKFLFGVAEGLAPIIDQPE